MKLVTLEAVDTTRSAGLEGESFYRMMSQHYAW